MKKLKLVEILNNFSKQQLVSIIKQYPGNYYQKYGQKELIKKIANILLEKNDISVWLRFATKTDLDYLRAIINDKPVTNACYFAIDYWKKSNLVFDYNDEIWIAQELLAAYLDIDNLNKRKQEMELYLRCFVNCYFIIEVQMAVAFINKYSVNNYSIKEIIAYLNERSEVFDLVKFFFVDDLIVNAEVFTLLNNTISSYQAFYQRQIGIDYKVYAKEEILKYENMNYVKQTTAFTAVVYFLRYYFDISESLANTYTTKLILLARCEYPPAYLVNFCHQKGLKFEKAIEERMLFNLFVQLVNRIDLPQYRGYSAMEVTNYKILI